MEKHIKVDLDFSKLEPHFETGMTRVVKAAERKAVMHTVPIKKGNLRSTIFSRIKGAGRKVLGILEANAKYAKAVHEGTGIFGPYRKPFTIKPKKAKALRFFVAGRPVFASKVTIQGMKANPFLQRALDIVLPARLKELLKF